MLICKLYKKPYKLSFCLLTYLLTSLFCSLGLHAQERILSFDSNIQIYADGQITVTETIDVWADGNNIRRGIFREFPTLYENSYGNNVRVGFQVISIKRDGIAETWRQQRQVNGVRIYIGDEDVFLSPGQYSYEISYATSRQIGFFAEHDELYWNVTGNGWDFPIEKTGATVLLPEGVPIADLTMEGYTGYLGASGQSYTSALFVGGGDIDSTRSLAAHEGLTLVITWPKGIIAEPGDLQKLLYLMRDNRALIVIVVGLAGLLLYMFLTWSKVGRDPKRGLIFPLYEPPEGYSPASARYISKMKYDNKTLTAAILNLAVKGYLSITLEKKTYTLTKMKSDAALAPGEEFVLLNLFSKEDTIKLTQTNRKELTLAIEGHRKALRKDYLGKYFFKNTLYLWPSIIGSMALFVSLLMFEGLTERAFFLFPILLILNVVFAKLLKAPSRVGRELMDKLEGFKMFLEVAEKDDLNLRNPPEKTPELFEKYLPFAIALEVEQAWAENFTEVFARLQAQSGKQYHPIWYHGNFNSGKIGDFSRDVGKGFNSAISSASIPPGSSSGAGGGGFSGGGGGGGGGGGW